MIVNLQRIIPVDHRKRAFFEKHGYTVMREQKAKANRLYMTNFVMMKIL